MRLGPKSRPSLQWGLSREPSDRNCNALTYQATLPYGALQKPQTLLPLNLSDPNFYNNFVQLFDLYSHICFFVCYILLLTHGFLIPVLYNFLRQVLLFIQQYGNEFMEIYKYGNTEFFIQCCADQLTGFYMRATLAFNGLTCTDCRANANLRS